MRAPRLELDGFGFGEGLRWHGGRLWFSDFLLHRVVSLGTSGDVRTELELDDRPSGLGWLPDGRLLVVSMGRRAVLRHEDGSLVVHADLADLLPADANDMVVDEDGTCYVGNFGSNVMSGERPRTTQLAIIRPDGSVDLGADELGFPNGSVITPDRTLIVGETMAHRYTAFPIASDGSLGPGRLWADLGSRLPDGCTLDGDGAIWFANAGGREVVRVAEGGAVLDVVESEETAYACALGGEAGRTLFFVTAPSPPYHDAPVGGGRLWSIDVDAPHAGRP